jgi:hypothetical protein
MGGESGGALNKSTTAGLLVGELPGENVLHHFLSEVRGPKIAALKNSQKNSQKKS